MKAYLDLVAQVLREGEPRRDRTGIGTYAVFDARLQFDLSLGFPLVTTKKVHWKSVAHELLWFLSGSTNTAYLKQNGVSIWDEWAESNGEVGRLYGVQWRKWRGLAMANGEAYMRYYDQIASLIADLKTNPTSRRLMVSAWNVADVTEGAMALPPCHYGFQCFSHVDGRLDLKAHMRSVDIFLGLPFNIASYALLLHMLAHVTGHVPGRLIMDLGDTHLYQNHVAQAREQLQRSPRALPWLHIKRLVPGIDDFTFEDFEIAGYNPWPHIAAPVAV